MRRFLLIVFYCITGSIFLFLNAQEPITGDSITYQQQENRKSPRDTVPLFDTRKAVPADSVILIGKSEFKPDSKKAVIYSAIFPGLGQLYNRKYWKLPIIYGGALGLTYAITWNGRMYGDYKQAFEDLVTGSGTSYMNFMRPGSTIEDYGGAEALQSRLRRQKDYFRRNRDLAIIVAVGVYALCMIDAYVDAQLYDFDMSPDLSMRLAPVFWPPTAYSKAGFGIQCNIIF